MCFFPNDETAKPAHAHVEQGGTRAAVCDVQPWPLLRLLCADGVVVERLNRLDEGLQSVVFRSLMVHLLVVQA